MAPSWGVGIISRPFSRRDIHGYWVPSKYTRKYTHQVGCWFTEAGLQQPQLKWWQPKLKKSSRQKNGLWKTCLVKLIITNRNMGPAHKISHNVQHKQLHFCCGSGARLHTSSVLQIPSRGAEREMLTNISIQGRAPKQGWTWCVLAYHQALQSTHKSTFRVLQNDN